MQASSEPGRGQMHWVHRLAPTDELPVPVPVSGPELLARVTAEVGPQAVAWAAQVGAETATRIIEEMPYFGPDERWTELLRMGTESATLSALLMLASPYGDVPPLTDEAKCAIAPYVEQGISLDQVLRGIRLGHAGMSSAFLGACGALVEDEDRVAVTRAVSARLFEHIDRFAREAAEFYKECYERWSRSATAVVRATVEALLAGQTVSAADLKSLPYSLTQHHRAIVVSKVTSEGLRLQQIAHDALRCIGSTTQLIVPASETTVWAWGGCPPGSAAQTSSLVARVYPGAHVAVGPMVTGLDGFRRAHLDALAVSRIQRLSSRPREVLVFDDVEMVTLLMQDPLAATRFMRRVLGPLAATGEQNEDLRATVKTYLDVHGSPSAAAQRLHLARNTVSARVQRASTLLHREIGVDCADLHTALILADTVGDAVLDPAP